MLHSFIKMSMGSSGVKGLKWALICLSFLSNRWHENKRSTCLFYDQDNIYFETVVH